jgi:hypothetical protein
VKCSGRSQCLRCERCDGRAGVSVTEPLDDGQVSGAGVGRQRRWVGDDASMEESSVTCIVILLVDVCECV